MADGDGAHSAGGDFKGPAGQRYHLAREITALWHETDPATRSRLWIAMIVSRPHYYNPGRESKHGKCLIEQAAGAIRELPQEPRKNTIEAMIAAAPELRYYPETTDWLRGLGVASPRVGLAGLNPHAGEGGLLGREDEAVLRPAVAAAVADGVAASGPWPGDTVFVRAAKGELDAVVACYHDQGLIPIKLLAFGHAVNVTIGLPIIRTSVDHGTAFDIAGRGVADPGSMVTAIRLAARLAEARR